MEFILQNLMLVALAIVSGGALIVMTLRRSGGSSGVTPTEATQLINREDAVLVDIREPDEYVAGHIPESRNIPQSRLAERIAEIERFKEAPLIVLCQSGARSLAACKDLQQRGFTKVNNLAGGIEAWRSAGLPLKKGAKK